MKIEKEYIGCGTLWVICMIGIIITAWYVNKEPEEKLAVDYIIENIQQFEGDFQKMGYEAEALGTGEDGEGKAGVWGRGVLYLFNDREEFWFDIGFDGYEVAKENDIRISMAKVDEKKVVNLKKKRKDYPVWVELYAPEYDVKYGNDPWNCYNLDFVDYRIVWDGEMEDDIKIKKYISSQELRQMFEKAMALQDKLVELYRAKTK